MGKRYNQSSDSKYQQFDDDFEDFGYEVKNIRRQTKKKVTKFKREVNEYDDTYWTGIVISHSSRLRVLYTCWRDFFMFMHRLPNGKLTMHEGLPRELAIKRMQNEERWMREQRAELATSSQQLFDDMFGGWCNKLLCQSGQCPPLPPDRQTPCL